MQNIRQANYATPTRTDMAVLMCMFNPTQSVRIVQNWLYVWNKFVSAGIPVFGIELLFPWQRSASLADAFKTLTVRSDSIMFHKEKLLERLEREVPASYTKLCWVDCDIVFQKADWYDATSVQLDKVAIVQPYGRCQWLLPDLRTPMLANNSAAANIDEIRAAHAAGISDRLNGHPGFAMAMRRGHVRHFTWSVVGGGDAVFFRGVCGMVSEFANQRMRELMEPVCTEWVTDARSKHTKEMGCVHGDIWHMWHGPINSRQYYDRYKQFIAVVPKDVKDIRELLVENADGVWSWRTDVRGALNKMMLHYFNGRDDDSVATS